MALKHTHHMSDAQINKAIQLLNSRQEMLEEVGECEGLSFAKIGEKVGTSGEAVRLLSLRDMSQTARAERKYAQYHSASKLSEAEADIAAGWIVCHDMLRLNTSVELFHAFLCPSFLLILLACEINVFIS
jgi:hypothetical protein